MNEPVFVSAMRIFGKLGEANRVQEVWNHALGAQAVSDILASARIAAAADEGDVETAADVLDLMMNRSVSIQVHHVNSALRACWGWGKNQHKAAKYFFKLFKRFQLVPTLISFTCLIGAYKTSPLDDVLAAYDNMKHREILADPVFAETYIFTVLQGNHGDVWSTVPKTTQGLRNKPPERLQAARKALDQFKASGVQLTQLCRKVDAALEQLRF